MESLFDKVAGLKSCNFIKKRFQHNCFPVSNAIYIYFKKHLRTAISVSCEVLCYSFCLNQLLLLQYNLGAVLI